MSRSQLDALIHMVNQIATHNAHYADATERVHAHLQKFWARGMKRQIVVYLDEDGSQLSPLALAAVERLARAQPA